MQTLDIQLTNVDRLGMLLAQIAELQEQAEALKDGLKNEGEGRYAGNLYDAVVTLSERATVDYKQLIKDLGVDAATLKQYTTTSATITCKVTARKA